LSNPADVPYILNWHLENEKKPIQKKLFVELDVAEKVIYNFLKRTRQRTVGCNCLKMRYANL